MSANRGGILLQLGVEFEGKAVFQQTWKWHTSEGPGVVVTATDSEHANNVRKEWSTKQRSYEEVDVRSTIDVDLV